MAAEVDKATLLVQSILSIIKPTNVTQEDYAALAKIVSRQPLHGADELIQNLVHVASELEANEQRVVNWHAVQQDVLASRHAPVTEVTNPAKRTAEQTAKLQDWLIKHMVGVSLSH